MMQVVFDQVPVNDRLKEDYKTMTTAPFGEPESIPPTDNISEAVFEFAKWHLSDTSSAACSLPWL